MICILNKDKLPYIYLQGSIYLHKQLRDLYRKCYEKALFSYVMHTLELKK